VAALPFRFLLLSSLFFPSFAAEGFRLGRCLCRWCGRGGEGGAGTRVGDLHRRHEVREHAPREETYHPGLDRFFSFCRRLYFRRSSSLTASSFASPPIQKHTIKKTHALSSLSRRRFPPPPRRDAAIIVGAEADAYVSKSAVEELARHWGAASAASAAGEGGEEGPGPPGGPRSEVKGGGAEVRWVPGGHVSAFLSQGEAFRGALRDAMERLALPAPAAAVAAAAAAEAERRGRQKR
jgi:hypothetical protein